MIHQRLRTMMPGAHSNAFFVQNGRYVVGMGGAIHSERKNCAFFWRIALYVQPVETAKALLGVIAQIGFVAYNVVKSQIPQILQRRAKTAQTVIDIIFFAILVDRDPGF